MQENYETLISLAEEMAISLPRITALAESHRRGLASGFPLSKPDLLSWMDRGEDSWVPDLPESETREITRDSGPDAILKNQEALQMVLRNQELLKDLVDRLQKTVSSIDERLRAIEQETGLLAQFTQELNEVGSEVSWD